MLSQLPPVASIFSQMSGSLSVPPLLILTLAAIITTITLIISIVLFYHWKHYAVDVKEMVPVHFWYLIGAGIFGTGMILCALGYALLSGKTL